MWRRLLEECLRNFDDLNEFWVLFTFDVGKKCLLDFDDVCF